MPPKRGILVRFQSGGPTTISASHHKTPLNNKNQWLRENSLGKRIPQNTTEKHYFLLRSTINLRRTYDGDLVASLKKTAGGWQAQVAIKGHREARSFSTKAEANAWAAERETEIRRQVATGIDARKTVGDAFLRYGKEVSIRKKKPRWEQVRLSKRARELIGFLPPVEKGHPIFALTPSQLDANFRKLREAACIDGLTFHDTRHEAITRLARKLNVLELARMVGHRDLKMLQIYYNETAENLAVRLD